MATCSSALQMKSSIHKPSLISHTFDRFKNILISSFKPLLREFQHLPIQIDVSKTLKNTSREVLDAFVDSVFEFVTQPYPPSQSNFTPVEELGDPILVNNVEGGIPNDFPEGIYVRNGANPLFGGLHSTLSMFGRSNNIWVEGEGMIHALYFTKESDGSWSIIYNNKHVQTDTFKFDKERNKPSFIPTVEGDSPAILSAYLLNMFRYGKVNKVISNTNVFEHSGKFYSISEGDMPQEIDILTLDTFGTWDVNGAWNRPFTSHPKKAPGTGELVTMGVDAKKPFLEVGVISADGMKLVHKVDVKFNRCSLCHDIGVTQRYNVIMDFPLTVDIDRVIKGGPLIRFEDKDYARIAVMPRYGDEDSIRWFEVQTCSAFHIINCFEEGDEVVMRACRARGSVLPGPDLGFEKFEYFSRGFKHINSVGEKIDSEGLFFTRAYEWRLNMKTGGVKERNLTGTDYSMDFPMINENFTGVKNKFGYTQVVDSEASSAAGLPKYKGLAKLYFEESGEDKGEELIKDAYHIFPENTFCSGAAFVSKDGGLEEDDGWIVTFVHNEDRNISQVYIIDAKKFSDEPVAIIALPNRVPYGFHGAFMSVPCHLQKVRGAL